jgi:hypothetical protein
MALRYPPPNFVECAGMKVLTPLFAALMLAAPLLAGRAHAFNTVTDGGTSAGTASAFSDHNDPLKSDGGGQGTAGFVHKDGAFTYGFHMQSGNSPGIGDGTFQPFMGGSMSDSNSTLRSFESYIPRP